MTGGNVIHADWSHVIVGNSAVDAQGRLYLAGYTVPFSASTPAGRAVLIPPATLTMGGGRSDIFVARFSADGARLDYLVHLGGAGDERVTAMALDGNGRVHVTGWTESPDFPVAAMHQQIGAGGGRDAFVLVLEADGSGLAASARMGGAEDDEANAVAVAADGRVVLAGVTASSAFPTTEGALQRTHRGKSDGFVLVLDANTTGLRWSTFVGGPTRDEIHSIALRPDGTVIAAGVTGDEDKVDPGLPVTASSFGPQYHGRRDAFVVKLNANGSGVEWGGYLGGDELDVAMQVRIAPSGNIVVMGETYSVPALTRFGYLPSPRFPLVPEPAHGEAQPPFHRLATFLTGISADGRNLVFSRVPRIVGGFATGMHLAPDGSLAVLGFPSSNVLSPFHVLSPSSNPGTDLVTDTNSFDWGSWAYAVVFNEDASEVRMNTRGFPVFRTSYRSMAFAADGRLHLIAETREGDLPLGPVTATAPRMETGIRLRSAYVLTLRTDGETPCAPSLDGLPAELNPGGGSFSVKIEAEAGCPWNFLRGFGAVPGTGVGTTYDLTFPAAGIGNGELTASYSANNSAFSLCPGISGSMTTQCVRQRSTRCGEASSPTRALAFGAAGGTQEVVLKVIPECDLQPQAEVSWPQTPWFRVAGTTDFDTMRVSVSVGANPGLARAGSLRVGNHSIPVQQASASGCAVGFPDKPIEVGPLGGTAFLPFTLASPECLWTVASAGPWVTLASPAIGAGATATAQFQVEPFASQSYRETTVIVNGLPFPIRQAGFDLSTAPEILSVVDAASYQPQRLASGGLATIFGRQLTGAIAHATATPLPTVLGEVVLRIRLSNGAELQAPLIYTGPGQINFQIPEAVVGAVEFRVENGQRISDWVPANVLPFYPTLFQLFTLHGYPLTFAGYAQLMLPDGTVRITPLAQPSETFGWTYRGVDRGPEGSELYIVLFGTGFPADATLDEYRGPSAQPRFTVQFAGPHPDFVGLQQINIHIPRDVFISGGPSMSFAEFNLMVRGIFTDTRNIAFESRPNP